VKSTPMNKRITEFATKVASSHPEVAYELTRISTYDRTASFFTTEKSEEGETFYVKKTPVGTYIFNPNVAGGELGIDSVDWGFQNLAESLNLRSAEAFVKKDLQKRQVEEKQEEKQVRTIAEQLRDLAEDVRKADSDEIVKGRYIMFLQQAQELGLISDKLRRQINKVNRGIGSLHGGESGAILESMAKMLELVAEEATHRKLAALRVAARHQRSILADQPPGERKRDQTLTKPINNPRGIEKSIVQEHARGVDHRTDTLNPDRRDIRPEDVFHGTPAQMNVRNLAETGKDLDTKTQKQIQHDKGYDVVNNLSQYLIRTDGGGSGGPEGKHV